MVTFQLSKVVYYRHNFYSFKVGFLILSFLWSGMRVAFWLCNVESLVLWLQLLIYWTPNLLQFATFALIVILWVFR